MVKCSYAISPVLPPILRQTGNPCLAAINYAMSAPAPKPLEVKFLSALETICLEELLQASPHSANFFCQLSM